MKIIKLKITAYEDRLNTIKALINSYHKVWLENNDRAAYDSDDIICFEIDDDADEIKQC